MPCDACGESRRRGVAERGVRALGVAVFGSLGDHGAGLAKPQEQRLASSSSRIRAVDPQGGEANLDEPVRHRLARRDVVSLDLRLA